MTAKDIVLEIGYGDIFEFVLDGQTGTLEKRGSAFLTLNESLPLDGDNAAGHMKGAVIPLKRYYPNAADISFASVENEVTDKRIAVWLSSDRKELYVIPTNGTQNWLGGDGINQRSDSFRYYLKMNGAENTDASVTLKPLQLKQFGTYPEDIYVGLYDPITRLVQIDIRKFNPLLDSDTYIAGFGEYDPALIYDIRAAAEDPTSVQVRLKKENTCWGCEGTLFDVFLEKTEGNKTLRNKLTVRLYQQCDTFKVNDIEIEVVGAMPESVLMNVQDYNQHARIKLVHVQPVPQDRGVMLFDKGGVLVEYKSNLYTNYWTGNHAEDMFRYVVQNNETGELAAGYIIIKKIQVENFYSSSGTNSFNLDDRHRYYIAEGSILIKKYNAGPVSVIAEGNINIYDKSNNIISLPAWLNINPYDFSFVGYAGGYSIKGHLHAQHEDIFNLEPNTSLGDLTGHFEITGAGPSVGAEYNNDFNNDFTNP